jgi:DNA polymerase-3 subunit delta
MPVITITGDNDFARSQALKSLVGDFIKAESDLALERLDGETTEFVRIQEALTSVPFLANTKMVVLSSPTKNKEFAEQAESLLQALPDTTQLILHEPKFDKRSSLYKLLKKQTDFREYSAVDGPALAKWLTEMAKAQGASLTLGDARYLIDRLGPHQQLLASEIEKLSIAGGSITRERIDALTDPAPQSTIFQLLDAALAGKAKQAIAIYDEQRALRVEPQQIIAMFAWQLHIMALMKTAGSRGADEVAREAKISPYVAGKSRSLVQQLSLPDILRMITDLLDIDARSKREAIDLDEALRFYIISLAGA